MSPTMLLQMKTCQKCSGKLTVNGFQGYNLHLKCRNCDTIHTVHASELESDVYPTRREREED